MAVKRSAQTSSWTRGRLRPMDPARDLGTITDLIADAFSHELDVRGQAALREMRRLARWWPFVWWWARADPTFNEAFCGFVWEEPPSEGKKSQVVGNVSLNRAPGSRKHWIICNVVVQEQHRGKGIGRSLIQAAVDEAQDLGAAAAVLQVYKDNHVALQLYNELGFHGTSGETDLRLEKVGTVAVLDAAGYRFRMWQAIDGKAGVELARLVTPPSQQWLRPLQVNAYQLDWLTRVGQWLADLFATRRTYRLVALNQNRLVAVMTVTAAFRQGEHSLALLVHPDHVGRVEAALISRALHMLAAAPPKPVKTTIGTGHDSILKALRGYGFEEQGTLLTLSKEFE